MTKLFKMMLAIIMMALVSYGEKLEIRLEGNITHRERKPIIYNDDKTSSVFERSRDKLVVIEGEDVDRTRFNRKGSTPSKGSGFIANMDGKTWMFTNRHVATQRGRLRAKLLSGRELKLGDIEVAEDRDLVRYEIKEDIPALEIDERDPTFGDEIEVYGNSTGAGVVTRIIGRVRGIGPNDIEVDAQFVQGNSGSPIINAKTGKVIGVATYYRDGVLDEDRDNEIKRRGRVYEQTRFLDTRWFGVRMACTEWNPIGTKAFRYHANQLEDLERFCKVMRKVCFAKEFVVKTKDGAEEVETRRLWFRMREYDEEPNYLVLPELKAELKKIADRDEVYYKECCKLLEMLKRNDDMEQRPENQSPDPKARVRTRWIQMDGWLVRQTRVKESKKINLAAGRMEYTAKNKLESQEKRIEACKRDSIVAQYLALKGGLRILRSTKWRMKWFKDWASALEGEYETVLKDFVEDDNNHYVLQRAGKISNF